MAAAERPWRSLTCFVRLQAQLRRQWRLQPSGAGGAVRRRVGGAVACPQLSHLPVLVAVVAATKSPAGVRRACPDGAVTQKYACLIWRIKRAHTGLNCRVIHHSVRPAVLPSARRELKEIGQIFKMCFILKGWLMADGR